jgi:hypothetical protein
MAAPMKSPAPITAAVAFRFAKFHSPSRSEDRIASNGRALKYIEVLCAARAAPETG